MPSIRTSLFRLSPAAKTAGAKCRRGHVHHHAMCRPRRAEVAERPRTRGVIALTGLTGRASRPKFRVAISMPGCIFCAACPPGRRSRPEPLSARSLRVQRLRLLAVRRRGASASRLTTKGPKRRGGVQQARSDCSAVPPGGCSTSCVQPRRAPPP